MINVLFMALFDYDLLVIKILVCLLSHLSQTLLGETQWNDEPPRNEGIGLPSFPPFLDPALAGLIGMINLFVMRVLVRLLFHPS